MKSKTLTGLGLMAIALTLFFNSNSVNSNNTDLASLITLSVANAEDPDGDECFKRPNYACYAQSTGNVIMHCDEDKWYTIANCY